VTPGVGGVGTVGSADDGGGVILNGEETGGTAVSAGEPPEPGVIVDVEVLVLEPSGSGSVEEWGLSKGTMRS
jgi:hypothetical protein